MRAAALALENTAAIEQSLRCDTTPWNHPQARRGPVRRRIRPAPAGGIALVTPTVILLAPSMASAIELPRRLASTGRALALHRFPEPGRDHYRSGVRALGRTLAELRQEAVPPERLEAVATAAARSPEDGARLATLARLYRRFEEERAGRVADPATVLEAAIPALEGAHWLRGAEVLIVEDLELDGREQAFLAALAERVPVHRLARARPPSLEPSSFGPWAEAHGITAVSWEKTILAPLTPTAPPAGLARLRTAIFEPSEGPEVRDGSVELVTAPGEAAEARAIARRLLRAAAEGVPFEEMGVILARADRYAPLFTDLFDRLGIPHQLHPSLPLRFGLCARSLLLLFRCRGLARPLGRLEPRRPDRVGPGSVDRGPAGPRRGGARGGRASRAAGAARAPAPPGARRGVAARSGADPVRRAGRAVRGRPLARVVGAPARGVRPLDTPAHANEGRRDGAGRP